MLGIYILKKKIKIYILFLLIINKFLCLGKTMALFWKKNKKTNIENENNDSEDTESYVLVVKGIKKSYGKVEVLKGIDFKVKAGEKIAIVGANGAGKTTLSEIIAKVKEPSGGHIYYSFGKTKSEISSKIGIQFQDSSYPDFYKVKDLVNFIIQASGIKISDAELQHIYETFDLWKMRKEVAKGLSGGQQQRLNILLAIINNPKLLILDEVGTGLDVESRTKIKSYIKSYIDEYKATLLLVSHNADEVMELTDRVIVVHNGLIYKDLLLKDILAEWKHFDNYMNYLYLEVFKRDLDLRVNKTGRQKSKHKEKENKIIDYEENNQKQLSEIRQEPLEKQDQKLSENLNEPHLEEEIEVIKEGIQELKEEIKEIKLEEDLHFDELSKSINSNSKKNNNTINIHTNVKDDALYEIKKILKETKEILKNKNSHIKIKSIKGIGPKIEKYFNDNEIHYISDLIYVLKKENLENFIKNIPGLSSEGFDSKKQKMTNFLKNANLLLKEEMKKQKLNHYSNKKETLDNKN